MSANPTPARSVTPGRVIKKELEARGWTQVDLARILGRPEQTVSEIVQGRKQITPETALGLAQAFGTSAEMWLGLEARFRLAEARRGAPDDQVRRRSALYSVLPLREIVKRGWIADAEDTEQLEEEVKTFLGVSALESIPALKLAARRTATKAPDERAVLAWRRRVELLAARQQVAGFDRLRLEEGIDDVLRLSEREEDVAQVPGALAGLGVRFVIVPHLAGTYMDGAVLAAEGEPVVALTLRYDRLDNFWFTLVHELEHLLQGHGGSRLECLDDPPERDSEEARADQGAAERLVPEAALQEFVSRISPYFSRSSIEAFASIGRHPSIVLGRLHHDGHVKRSHLRRTIPPVRRLLEPWIDAPTAVVPTTGSRARRGGKGNGTAQEAANLILTWLRSNPGWHARSDVLRGTGLTAGRWTPAIKALMQSKAVETTGEKRGRRYRARN
jgi:HTH-type transcriptional regulator/antitoxin HigA